MAERSDRTQIAGPEPMDIDEGVDSEWEAAANATFNARDGAVKNSDMEVDSGAPKGDEAEEAERMEKEWEEAAGAAFDAFEAAMGKVEVDALAPELSRQQADRDSLIAVVSRRSESLSVTLMGTSESHCYYQRTRTELKPTKQHTSSTRWILSRSKEYTRSGLRSISSHRNDCQLDFSTTNSSFSLCQGGASSQTNGEVEAFSHGVRQLGLQASCRSRDIAKPIGVCQYHDRNILSSHP